MLQQGLGFALLPRLKACDSRAAIVRLLQREFLLVAAVSVVAAVGVLLLTPLLLRVVLESRYAFPMTLLHALVAVGFVRVWSGISGATVAALGTVRQLMIFNVCSWIAVAVAAAGAFAARRSGLPGVVYGLGAGWLALAIAGSAIGFRAVGARGAAAGEPR
jgi:hypothetical protein